MRSPVDRLPARASGSIWVAPNRARASAARARWIGQSTRQPKPTRGAPGHQDVLGNRQGRNDVEFLVEEPEPKCRCIGRAIEFPFCAIDLDRHRINFNDARQCLDQG
jgi:hypothetical protein